MTIRLTLLRETDKARLYRFSDGTTTWIPRSVVKSTVKFSNPDLNSPVEQATNVIHELVIEDWWWDKYMEETYD